MGYSVRRNYIIHVWFLVWPAGTRQKKSSSNNAQFYSPPRGCKADSQTTQQESCESTNNNALLIVRHVLCVDLCGSHLKKATREMERSSKGVRDEANMDLSTAGVTGIFLSESDGGTGEMPRVLLGTGDDGMLRSAADHAAPLVILQLITWFVVTTSLLHDATG